MITLNFHSDAGHGWLEVPAALVDELWVAAIFRPTYFSYYSKGTNCYYLEEDCDAPNFERIQQARGIMFTIVSINHRGMCFIRTLPRV